MRKFFSTILATWILIGILPANAWAQDANPDSRAQATPDNEDTSSNLVCPDPEAEVVFSEGRARIMEVLKEKNPELYNRLVALWKERNKRLAELCEKHPELYKRIIALQERVRARREAHQEDRLEHREEKIEARIENETERMAEKKEKLKEKLRKRRLQLCREFPNADGCESVRAELDQKSDHDHPDDDHEDQDHEGDHDDEPDGDDDSDSRSS